MRKIVFHWERISFGTLMYLGAAQQAEGDEQLLLISRAIDPLINGKSLIDRPIAEAYAIIAQFGAEGATKIPEALAQLNLHASLPQLPPPARPKDTAEYTAQPGGEPTKN